jgi:hypothetical protein
MEKTLSQLIGVLEREIIAIDEELRDDPENQHPVSLRAKSHSAQMIEHLRHLRQLSTPSVMIAYMHANSMNPNFFYDCFDEDNTKRTELGTSLYEKLLWDLLGSTLST